MELELESSISFLEWLANNYKKYGASLEIITDRSQEGAQFVRGFGGVGGLQLDKTLQHSIRLIERNFRTPSLSSGLSISGGGSAG